MIMHAKNGIKALFLSHSNSTHYNIVPWQQDSDKALFLFNWKLIIEIKFCSAQLIRGCKKDDVTLGRLLCKFKITIGLRNAPAVKILWRHTEAEIWLGKKNLKYTQKQYS